MRPSLLLRPVGAIVVLALGLMGGSMLIALPGLGASAAWAKDGADDGGSGGDDHGGDDRGGKDDKGGGEDRRGRDDSPGSGSSGSSQRSEDGGSPAGAGTGTGSGCAGSGESLDLRYADGFHEHVSGCNYVLTDDHGRVVITRAATQRDIERLEAAKP